MACANPIEIEVDRIELTRLFERLGVAIRAGDLPAAEAAAASCLELGIVEDGGGIPSKTQRVALALLYSIRRPSDRSRPDVAIVH